MAADAFLSAISTVAGALFLGAGVFVYGSLTRQISARAAHAPSPELRGFGVGDAILAVVLCSWFALNITAAAQHQITSMRTRDLVAQGLFTIGLVLFVVAFLRIRGLHINALGGFSQLGLRRAVITGAVLLLAAYPLLALGETFTRAVLRHEPERQPIVEMFNSSSTIEQRVMIIVLAVALAPIAEEFLFRFFLYGVLKRYFGRLIGIFANAALFAAVHAHLPSVIPLFVLGGCLSIAFEWSGSILVAMSMHALFNTLTLVALAFPDFISQ